MGATGGCGTDTGPEKMRIREKGPCWKRRFAKQTLFAIEVGENCSEEQGTLDNRSFDEIPFFGADDERNRIHRPEIFIAIGKIAEVVCHALRLDQLLSALPSAAEVTEPHSTNFKDKFPPVPARYSGSQ